MRALLLEQTALLVEFGRIDARAQDADDESLRMCLHGVHDQVPVADRDVLAVHLLHLLRVSSQ